MAQESFDFDYDVKRIIEEVQDLECDPNNLNIDEILKEHEEENLISLSNDLNHLHNSQKVENLSSIDNDEPLPTEEHPLKRIENHERDISSKLGGRIDLDSKFLLSNYTSSFSPNYSSFYYSILDKIGTHCFSTQNEGSSFKKQNHEHFGTPKCIAVNI